MTEPIIGEENKNEAVNSAGTTSLGAVKRQLTIGFSAVLGIALVFTLGIGVYRAYAKGDTDKFTTTVARVLQLPLMRVDGVSVKYADYVDDLKAITRMRDYDKANNGPAASLTPEQMSDQVLFRQVNNILVEKLAKKYGVTIEQKDIDSVKNDILAKEFGSLDKAESAIKERYGWNMAQFEQKVIRSFVLQNKLTEKIKGDTARVDAVKQEAQSVLDQIKSGASFEEMAKQYGQDGTAAQGGDLGWFGKGDMVPAFETAAFSLKKGELDTNLVQSQFGFHIIRVDDKKTEKVKDENGKTVSKETVKARHILFMFPSIDKDLNDEIKAVSIKMYAKISNPFKDILKK